ncbi:MAG: hypothetical protein KatS3mg110_0990 [Pirellulaceae bacterium]|nr:MAG: hypothetical protein KatS3mg110_0990 [Pirellulaceae bacterium]
MTDGPAIHQRLGRTLWAVAALTLALAAAFPVAAYFGWRRHGDAGLAAAVLAMSVCWLGGTLALAAPWAAGRRNPVVGILLGSLFRMLVPLAGAITATIFWPPFRRVDGFGIIVAYFLWMLVWETLLSLWLVKQPSQATRVQ